MVNQFYHYFAYSVLPYFQSFAGCPMENKHMMNSLEKLFEVKYRKRKEEVLDDKDNKQAIQE